MSTDQTQTEDAFLKLCEALGIQACVAAYLEVPAIIRAAEKRGYQRGYYAGSHKNNQPTAQWGD